MAYAYIGKHPMPGFANLAPDKVEATITPDLLFPAHSSLPDLVFYQGDQFPAEYRGSLFVALKGSWNRSVPTGYKVVHMPLKDGRPEGWYENFATGFWASGEQRAEAAPPLLPSPRTARCSSPTTPAARSGASPTAAHPGRARGLAGRDDGINGSSAETHAEGHLALSALLQPRNNRIPHPPRS